MTEDKNRPTWARHSSWRPVQNHSDEITRELQLDVKPRPPSDKGSNEKESQ